MAAFEKEEVRTAAIVIELEDIPSEFPEVPEDQRAALLAKLHQAWHVLQQASLDVNRVVTWLDVGLDTSTADLVMGAAWKKFYPEPPPPVPQIPRKVLAVLTTALQQLGARFAERSAQEKEDAKEAARKVLKESKVLKRRIGPY